MFGLFKPKPREFADVELQEMATMFFTDPMEPTYRRELLPASLDFSLDSLKIIDEYLNRVRAEIKDHPPRPGELANLLYRCGAYVGEVIRRGAGQEWRWLSFDEAQRLDAQVREMGGRAETAAVLWKEGKNCLFPLAKVAERITDTQANGNGLHFYASAITALIEPT
jgi:hypothetical protein